MGVGVVVRGDVQRSRGPRHHAGGRLLSVALKELIGDVQRGGRDRQIVVAIAAAVCAAGGGHIDDQYAVPGLEMIAHTGEDGGVGGVVEGQRHGAVIGVGNGERADGRAAHGSNAAGYRVGRAFVERQVLRAGRSGRAKGHAQLDLRDADIPCRQVGQTVEFDRAFIARAAVDALTRLAAGP